MHSYEIVERSETTPVVTGKFSLCSMSSDDRAAFAVTSRLLSCLITESLLKAIFIPIDSPEVIGACVVLSNRTCTAATPSQEKLYGPDDFFVIVPLRALPVIEHSSAATVAKEIELVDPLDMLPWIYEVREDANPDLAMKPDLASAILSGLRLLGSACAERVTLVLSPDPIYLWKKFSANIDLSQEREETITQGLRSSFIWQKHAYENCPSRPTLDSSEIEWEQALVEGHPTHPMHRARQTLPPMPALLPDQYDFYQPRIRFVSIPRSSLSIEGDFETLLGPLRDSAARNAGRPLEVPAGYVLFPVHELQVINISTKFRDAIILPEEFSVSAPARASIRTLTLLCSPKLSLKLAVGVTVSSALRTITHFTAYHGPRFGRDVVPQLSINRDLLVIENEIASAVYQHEDPDIAKHCSAILREVYDGEEKGERVVIAAALVENGYSDSDDEIPAVVTALGLDTVPKKLAFLERYINLIFDAFLPPLLIHGIAFEAHGQNTLARFNRRTGLLIGFAVRDFGGLHVHVPTLLASTGVTLDTLPGHCIVVSDVHDAYKGLYHSLIHTHLHRLIRVLGFHHNGRGWEFVRRSLETRVPRESELWNAWLDPARTTVMSKCLMRMKLQGLYRDFIYNAVPNLIHYRPQTV